MHDDNHVLSLTRQHILDRGNEKINQRLSRVEAKDETGKVGVCNKWNEQNVARDVTSS